MTYNNNNNCQCGCNNGQYEISGEIITNGSISTDNNPISPEPDIQTGSVKTVTEQSKPSLPDSYNIDDKYLDLILNNPKNTQVLVNLSPLQDVYTAGEGISVENHVISNTKETAWGEISGTVSEQTDLINILDTKLNKDFSNVNTSFWDKINNSKALRTGDIGTDSDILSWLKNLNHSTFDTSKFTTVGSPIVTNDGIASGFSNTSLVRVNNTGIVTSLPWSIEEEFTPKDFSGTGFIICETYTQGPVAYISIDTSGKLRVHWKDENDNYIINYKLCSTVLSANTPYKVKVEFTGTQYNVYLTDLSTGVTTIEATANNSNPSLPLTNIALGARSVSNRYDNHFSGSINLKSVLIKSNGIVTFRGNKTGIDTIKPDDYTVVGSPTISADGVAGGFSGSNYLQASIPSLANATNFEIKAKFTVGDYTNGSSSNYSLLWSDASGSGKGISLWRYNISKLVVRYNTDYLLITDILNGDNIDITFKHFNSTLYCLCYKNGIKVYDSNVSHSATMNAWSGGLDIGNRRDDTSNSYWTGSIDLNAIKIYVDGDLVYQPCLKIPYTESKTGSKIVDAVYRDRVADMSAQFGYAPYFTLGDTDFTLPQGELYGLIEQVRKISENEIGLPIPTLSSTLKDNEIWLEGAEVSKSTYAKLYAIYGDSYGTPLSNSNFVLPDFTNRVMQGIGSSGTYGYIAAGLPNITGYFKGDDVDKVVDGAFSNDTTSVSGDGCESVSQSNKTITFDASRSSSIYGASATVQPPAVKVRFKTRYE